MKGAAKWENESMQDEIRRIISSAVHSAFVDYPARDNGTRWDQIYKEQAECELLTGAVLTALKRHGYEVIKSNQGSLRCEAGV
jgi:hypothetical protein